MIKRAFTLIELIVVIIIVGILAAVGISQYSKTVEKGRGAEAMTGLGQIRKLAFAYYLENGTFTGMQNQYVGIGASSDQLPGPTPDACRSSHWFSYRQWVASDGTYMLIWATRCIAGGKSPQGTEQVGPGRFIYTNGAETYVSSCFDANGNIVTGCAY